LQSHTFTLNGFVDDPGHHCLDVSMETPAHCQFWVHAGLRPQLAVKVMTLVQ
jgi:hypothetical protein